MGINILFRADASLQIGTGHIMRCLTLADALREQGGQCRFVCREHPGNLIDLIQRRGHEVSVLPAFEYHDPSAANPVHAAWLGVRWDEDAEQTRAALAGLTFDWLVVDHYALDARWERVMRAHAAQILVIDDLADRPHDSDLLIDQNLGRRASDYAALVPAHCKLLIGSVFALLRPEFALVRERSLARRQQPALKHLLLTMGGVDKDNVTLKVLDALQDCPLPPDCRLTVVMGAQAPWLATVQKRAATMPWPTEVLINVQDMATLMAESDLAIGAAGSTTWERCCLGLPSLIVVLAENQQGIAAALDTSGAGSSLGRAEDPDFSGKLVRAVHRLATASMALAFMSAKAQALVLGDGTQRVLQAMASLTGKH
jgi:UDP-2,4-diacetamido-2,4,6-trideoxy-beta-L-altropyranose hydrolase